MTATPGARRGRKPNAELSDPRLPRQRLLDSANELFYAEGVQSVGIERILEHAGVAKGSLYNTFGSKEALVRAYLDARHENTTSRLQDAIDAVDDPRKKILAVFDAQGQIFRQAEQLQLLYDGAGLAANIDHNPAIAKASRAAASALIDAAAQSPVR